MKRVSLVALLGSLLVAATAAQATTYVRVEKDGTKTYSDRPIPGGEPIDIQPAQTYSAPPPSLDRAMPLEQQQVLDAANVQYSCALTPRNDETFQNPGSVTVTVALTPAHRSGQRVSFSVDGAALPNEQNLTSQQLAQPERGSHTVSVHVSDLSGRTLCDANTTFHVQRTGLNSPARPRPVPPRPNAPRPTPH